MTDKIAEIRARHEAGAPGEMPIVALAQADADREFLLDEVERLTRERNDARAEVERQARHIEELREKIDAEKSCACSFDAPGDVCAAHSPTLAKARAEVERLRAQIVSLEATGAEASDEIDRLREALEAKP